MQAAAKTQTRFGRILRVELERHQSINSIRKLGRVIRPDAPETGRRALAKWISGEARPTRSSRLLVATALGLDPAVFSEDDEEEDAEMRDFFQALQQMIDRKLDARLKERVTA